MHGVRRGLFSSEAGEGFAPNAADTITVSHHVKQGLVQTLGVYFDAVLVCSITASRSPERRSPEGSRRLRRRLGHPLRHLHPLLPGRQLDRFADAGVEPRRHVRGAMVVINLVAVIPLGGVALKLLKNYAVQKKPGVDPVFHGDMLPELPTAKCWDGHRPSHRHAPERLAALRERG